MFTVIIETKNDAFADAPATELGRILDGLAKAVKDGQVSPRGDAYPLCDENGNRVGHAVLNLLEAR